MLNVPEVTYKPNWGWVIYTHSSFLYEYSITCHYNKDIVIVIVIVIMIFYFIEYDKITLQMILFAQV